MWFLPEIFLHNIIMAVNWPQAHRRGLFWQCNKQGEHNGLGGCSVFTDRPVPRNQSERKKESLQEISAFRRHLGAADRCPGTTRRFFGGNKGSSRSEGRPWDLVRSWRLCIDWKTSLPEVNNVIKLGNDYFLKTLCKIAVHTFFEE